MKTLLIPMVVLCLPLALAGQSAPDLSHIYPTDGVQGSTIVVNLTGSNFVKGTTTVAFSGSGIFPISVHVTSTTIAQVTAVLSAAPGRYNVRVTTPAGTTASSHVFTVTGGTLGNAAEFRVTSLTGVDSGPGSADGSPEFARFATPAGIWTDGTYAYVADIGNGILRRITLSTKQTTTVAGVAGRFGKSDGVGSAAAFSRPTGLWGDGANLYMTDTVNRAIRRVELSTGTVTTIVPNTTFAGPTGIWGDGKGNLYVADHYFSSSTRSIRKIVLSTDEVTTVGDLGSISGTDAFGATISGSRIPAFPIGLWGDGANLWIADSGRSTIRRMTLATGEISNFAGSDEAPGFRDGEGNVARFRFPGGIWGSGTDLFVADSGNDRIRRISTSTGKVTTVSELLVAPGAPDGVPTPLRLISPLALTGIGEDLYVTESANHDIRQIHVNPVVSMATVTGRATQAGDIDGTGTGVQFNAPAGISGDGVNVYVGDELNAKVRRMQIADSFVTTITPNPQFDNLFVGRPAGVWADGTQVFYADMFYNSIRRVILETGTHAHFSGISSTDYGQFERGYNVPYSVWGDGSSLYVVDALNYSIRKLRVIASANGVILQFAGSREQGVVDGIGANARFFAPAGIWGDFVNLYVLDANAIRKKFRLRRV